MSLRGVISVGMPMDLFLINIVLTSYYSYSDKGTDTRSGITQALFFTRRLFQVSCGQVCGSGMFMPDPKHEWQRILVFLTQIIVTKRSELRAEMFIPGLGFRIRIFPIPDPGSRGRKALDSGSGSATLVLAYSRTIELLLVFIVSYSMPNIRISCPSQIPDPHHRI